MCNWFCVYLQKIDAQAIEEFYGLTSEISKNSESGYILFYQSRDWACCFYLMRAGRGLQGWGCWIPHGGRPAVKFKIIWPRLHPCILQCTIWEDRHWHHLCQHTLNPWFAWHRGPCVDGLIQPHQKEVACKLFCFDSGVSQGHMYRVVVWMSKTRRFVCICMDVSSLDVYFVCLCLSNCLFYLGKKESCKCHDLLGYMMMMPGVCTLSLAANQDGARGLPETCGLCMWGGMGVLFKRRGVVLGSRWGPPDFGGVYFYIVQSGICIKIIVRIILWNWPRKGNGLVRERYNTMVHFWYSFVGVGRLMCGFAWDGLLWNNHFLF